MLLPEGDRMWSEIYIIEFLGRLQIQCVVETYTKTFIQSVENPALDVFLTQLAIQSGKNVGAVETAEDQCAMLNNLNNTLASFYILFCLFTTCAWTKAP